ncbi:tetratricopeptide repeat protein [Novipirellula caenicola]|uniref:Lipoprotein NlpI n=1 Tax=Novipirellula caenicola TaxID=1536901 RepID=A0ABP9VU60_9BACT
MQLRRLVSKRPSTSLLLGVAASLAMQVTCLSLACPGQEANSMSISSLRASGLKALQEGNRNLAVESADAIVRLHSKDARAVRLAADIYLRSGKVDWATRLFNRYVSVAPEQMPELWQRGIALYFTGNFQEAAKQFEAHRSVNPNDVENAAWHFLCVAKANSFDEAKKLILPAPGDRRVPMQQILEMLSSGDTEAVNARVNETAVGTPERADAAFYGDFYLGLYADAAGDIERARKLLDRAAKDAPHHYMGDIARVYAAHLHSDDANTSVNE